MNRPGRFFAALFLCSALPGAALDFGLILRQTPVFTDGEESYGAFEYTGTAIPWFSSSLDSRSELYLSGGFSIKLKNKEWKPLGELYRFEYIYNFPSNLRLDLGRFPVQGSLPFSFNGLFDGASAAFTIGGGRFRAGIFYTGLLYKESAKIIMSQKDKDNFADDDIYFASRRIVAGVHWEQTGLLGRRNTLSLSGIGQFDLNGIGENDYIALHSQYLEAKFSIPLGNGFYTESGGVFELFENSEDETGTAFAALASISWLLPTALQDSLSLGGRFSSGAWNDTVVAFLPITAQSQGRVLNPSLTGIALIEGAYITRLWSALSAELSAVYYFRTDEISFFDSGMDDLSKSPLLGGEIYGALTWVPFSDMTFTAGAGVFLPKTGRVFRDDADSKYRVSLEAVISF
ncbi:MAG: hypothetical protein LBE10_05280 [Treponema sp.]|nr:hypothetical protein [Treponema sp.]